MRIRFHRLFTLVFFGAIAFVLAWYVAAQAAVGSMRELIVSKEDVAVAQVVIVPGASVLRNGAPSDVLADRLLTAIDVYNAGKAPKILASGDHGTQNYDEVNAMREYLLDAGIPRDDIFLDYAGFDTYDTMYRAHKVFGIERAIIATQTFHLPRALYIGDGVGMDVYGVAAERQEYIKDDLFAARERFANVKALLDVLRHAAPKYTGETFDISGDGRATWDGKEVDDDAGS